MLRSTNYDVELGFYRFLVGIAAGIALGNYVIPLLHSKSFCFENLPPISTAEESTSPATSSHVINDEISGTVYIGMMSMDDKMDTRVESAINTWMKHSTNGVKIEVFANNNGTFNKEKRFRESYLSNGIRVIQLPGVSDHVYPPQKKSFSMIKFMHDMYIDQYDWFVRLDDDAYVDAEKLVELLAKINSSKPLYIGNAGFGRDADDYVDIDSGENYCMGGTGMIFSKGLLRKLAPKLKECLGNLFTEHEDIELGRCVTRSSGVKCTMSWEFRRIFFQNFKDGTYAHNIEKPKHEDIERGVIFHANKKSEYQYNFHVETLHLKVKKLISKVSLLEKEIRKDYEDENAPFNWTANSHAHLRWDAIIHIHSYAPSDRQLKKRMHVNLMNRLLTNTNQYIQQVQKTATTKHKKLKTASLELSYYVVNPLLSADTISQIEFSYLLSSHPEGPKQKVNQYAYQRQYFPKYLQFFNEPHQIDVQYLQTQIESISNESFEKNIHPTLALTTDKNTVINFLVALSGRPGNFIRFIKNFENAFLANQAKVNLIVAFFPPSKENNKPDSIELIVNADTRSQSDVYEEQAETESQPENVVEFIQDNINILQEKYPRRIIEALLLPEGAEFSRGIGLQEASKFVKDKNEILFFCDVDLVFTSDLLHHIRRNTVQGKRVYYPVFFSQYDPDVVYVERPKPATHFRFEELDGFWRFFSFGMLSIYKSDFIRTPGYNTKIHGWGLEDVEMADSIVNAHLDVFQCPDPSQVHIYHDKFCDPSTTTKQYDDCMKSRATHYGPKTLLYYLYNAPIVENNEPDDKDAVVK